MRSINFVRAVGVFEGGGMRGAAHAGAFFQARECGINFEGTVGSSAGAIVAVFIAAGLTPDQVITELDRNFSDFLIPATPPRSLVGRSAARLSAIGGSSSQSWAKRYFSLGLHSSQGIQDWVNTVLKKYLPGASDTVEFKDLKKPVAILATNLLTNGHKVWSKDGTPDAPVGFAVRASCSIPFFFQPVDGEASLFVDGAVLSNLPLFLVPELKLPPDLPVLCFRLESDLKPVAVPKSGLSMVDYLVDTVIGGSSKIQLSMGHMRQVVSIRTGKIDSRQFDMSPEDINALVEAGKTAVLRFVMEEQQRVSYAGMHVEPEIGRYRENMLTETARLMSESAGEVWVMAGDLSWFREIHITVLSVVKAGRVVKILYDEPVDEALRGAIAVGARVTQARSKLPVKGTIVSPATESAELLAVEKNHDIVGRRLRMPSDRGLIAMITQRFEAEWNKGNLRSSGRTPALTAIPIAEIVTALKNGVPQYRDSIINVETVRISQLQLLSKYLEAFKLTRVSALDKLLAEEGVQNAARLEGSPWPLTPPVVERLRDGAIVVIDGAHRIYQARIDGKEEMRVVLVDNLKHNLPSKPLPDWAHILVLPHKKPREERYVDYNPGQFRPIRQAFKALAQ